MFDFSQEKIKMIFEVSEQNTVALKHFTNNLFEDNAKMLKWCNICDVHISGENHDDHHGAKHTGTWGGLSLRYESHRYYENEFGNKLEFVLMNKKIEVVVHYQFYKGISAVRSWTVVTNISDKTVGLEYVSSFCYTGIDENDAKVMIPHNAWVREIDWQEYTLSDLGMERITPFSTKRIFISNTGTWSTKEYLPMGAIQSNNTVYLWQIESSGSWQWEISDISDMLYLKLSGPTEQENGWYKELIPGESFESVKVCVAVGENFNVALGQMTKYRRQIFKNNIPNKKLPIIFNDYMHCLWADPTTEKMIPVIDKAAEVGAEYYCMDAGWYADGTWWETVGEWIPQDKRFPNGIKEVFDYIKSKGMVPGIWLEIEVMGVNCPILNQFSDDCFFMRHGEKVIDHGRYQLDFRNEKVRSFATSVVDRVVSEYGVGYIKFDYNIDGGLGTEVDSDSVGDGLLEHNRVYLDWISEIEQKYPDLILENCSSGGMRMDYNMLQKHHIQSVTDQDDYRYIGYISAGAPTAVLPEQAAIWSYPVKADDRDAVIFNMTSSMLQRIHLSGQITELDEKSFALVKEALDYYKNIRADIAEAVPFYPLGLPKYGDNISCVAFECKECIRLCVWCFKNAQNVILPINGQKLKIIYPSNSDIKVKLIDEGVSVDFPREYTSVVIEIERK